jgi:hypothetical protein
MLFSGLFRSNCMHLVYLGERQHMRTNRFLGTVRCLCLSLPVTNYSDICTYVENRKNFDSVFYFGTSLLQEIFGLLHLGKSASFHHNSMVDFFSDR